MKFLTKHDWQNKIKLFFNNNSLKETYAEKLFFEMSQLIRDLAKIKKFDHISYGIAMTFFHYYACFNELRNFDKLEVGFACLYMSSKIQFYKFTLVEFIKDYKNYNINTSGTEKKNPDFTKYETQLYSQLGYDLDIETPFHFFYNEFFAKTYFNKERMEKLKHFCFNLINDTYSRPLCIYYHPKIIYLSCVIFSLKFLEYNDFDINILIQNENIDLIAECMEQIYQIYSRYIENDTNKNNLNKNNNNNNTDIKK